MTDIRQRLEHRYTSNRLSAYVDDQLSAREKERVEKHLEVCADCRAEVRTLRWTKSLLHDTPTIPLPRSFVIPAVDHTPRPAWASHMLPRLRWATALVAIMFIGVLVGDLLTGRWTYLMQRQPALVSRKEEIRVAYETQAVDSISTPRPTTRAMPGVAAAPSPTLQAKGRAWPSPTPQVKVKVAATPAVEAEKVSSSPPPGTARAPAADNVAPPPTATLPPSPAPPCIAATLPSSTVTPCDLATETREMEYAPPATPEPKCPLATIPRLGWRVAEAVLGLTLLALAVTLAWAQSRQ